MLVDTHCHLDVLDDVPGVIARAREAGVARVVTIGVDRSSSLWAARAARAHNDVWATAGLHPHDAKDRSDDLMAALRMLAAEERVVGVGETGLDYHYDHSPREQQRAVFAEQIAIANEAGKALVIHTREAWDDTFEILTTEGIPARTVFHCFTGGPAEARRALEIGAFLSFSGVVTFRNAEDIREAVRVTPLDRMVLETDAPFLTPVPHRGKQNEPSYVVYIAAAIAALKNVDAQAVENATTDAATALFGPSFS